MSLFSSSLLPAGFFTLVFMLYLPFGNDIEAKSHKGVRGLLGKKFIKSGIIPKEFRQIFSDWFDFDADKVISFVPNVENFPELYFRV